MAKPVTEAVTDQTEREKAERRFVLAKHEFDCAAQALMNRDPGCIARADAARAEFSAAREQLQTITEGKEAPDGQ